MTEAEKIFFTVLFCKNYCNLTDALYGTILVEHSYLLEHANTTAISTFCLEKRHFALLPEEACFVDRSRCENYFF